MLVWRWTGDWPAGLIAGVILAFNAHSFTRLPHLRAQPSNFCRWSDWRSTMCCGSRRCGRRSGSRCGSRCRVSCPSTCGLFPASYQTHYAHLRGFPDAESIASLHQLGVTHVVVRDNAFRAWSSVAAANVVARTRDLVPIETDGDDVTLY